MTAPDAWLAGRPVERVGSLEALLERFRDRFQGLVVYDERVPATSNLASTVGGCDDLLPVRFDPVPGSLYQQLTDGPLRLPVRLRLLGEDGGPLFTGTGRIPGTDLPSTGSAKNDAYRWLIAHYVESGRANPGRMGYYLDAFWLRCWDASGPENHTLSNHDYVIAHRGVLFDLGVWDDEPAVDDPQQPPGTDAATLKRLLRAAWDRLGARASSTWPGSCPGPTSTPPSSRRAGRRGAGTRRSRPNGGTPRSCRASMPTWTRMRWVWAPWPMPPSSNTTRSSPAIRSRRNRRASA
ncbi:MAG: hypothetical protein M5U12_19435 [Verrucomicrobia bacterium]|nr:hypothetical protein [Verrucomicrobiota bacterium]